MACGVPTIGSVAGGMPELVSHGETGYLAPVGATDIMARYAIELLSDPPNMMLFQKRASRGVPISVSKRRYRCPV